MRKIKITRGYETLVDDDDYDRLIQFSWIAQPKPDGRVYVQTTSKRTYPYEKRRNIRMSRFIMNCPKNMVVDHINHDTLDNRKCNLRIATKSNNMHNRVSQSNNSSGYTGVCFNNRNKYKKWVATIRIGKKWPLYLGAFLTKEEAAVAYNKAAIKYHKEFATLNKIGGK